ncbi:MAG: outer membrane protein assembly factor BamD [Acidobacteriaceae bacterium]|nr:outer membrane protein assembly factor BamD [Acidobacteriaceae bacterium]
MMFSPAFRRSSVLALALTSGFALAPFTTHAQAAADQTPQTTDSQTTPQADAALSVDTHKKKKTPKSERVQQTKDTKQEIKKQDKLNPLATKDATLPDKQLYDKALGQVKSGHFEVARMDLQTLLNTYPDSQYQMRAKLAIADSWYREGGSAALAQAEQEYKDFITFFPNAPEAAEAQMRVGDIYFKQMDVPDRDYAKAISAETEYRTMLKQYPDAPPEILKQAKQKLRDVQEVLATREANIAAFYAGRENWPAAIARYDTVVDTYPQYSHMDDVLIGIGDAWGAEARKMRATPVCAPGVKVYCMTEAAKSRLEQEFDTKSATAYRQVVLEHSASLHVEDAKERLNAMNQPIPTPTADEVAASEALEGSRAQYTMYNRLKLLMVHSPDTVTAAQIGEPLLDDPAATTAPTIVNDLTTSFEEALNPNFHKALPAAPATNADASAPAADTTAAPASAAAPTLSDVPSAGNENTSGSVSEMSPASAGDTGGGGSHMGVEVVQPNAGELNRGSGSASDLPSATGKADSNYGLKSVAPANSTPLPEAEKPAEAPDQVNEVAGKKQAPVPQADATKKPSKPAYDKDEESSSKHKKKKGVDKLNPF